MSKTLRINYIDNIKIAITFLVVAHHAGQAYGNTGGVWLVTDEPKLEFLSSFFFLNAAYMMGFFFFVSGYFMYFSAARKSTKVFLKDRFRRLGIPLLFFMFAIFLPLNYLMSGTNGNYFLFMYDNYVNKPPLAVGHLWFVASLLAYTFIFLAVKKQILKSREIQWQAWYPLVFILLLSVVNYLVRLKYPIDHWETWLIPIEVAHLPQYLSLFLLGVVANKNNWLEQITVRQGLIYFFIGIGLFSCRNLIESYLPNNMTEALIETFLCVGIMMGSLVIFRKLANVTNPVLNYFSNCSFGIYLFHLLLVIAYQILLKDIQIPTFIKFILVSILGIISAAGITYVLRKNKLLSTIL
jgi:glucans biosynthesis protein C